MLYGQEYADLLREVGEIKRVIANMIKVGTVAEVDAEKGTVRLQYGERDGKPLLGPEVVWQEQGGKFKGWVPPSVGQIMTTINPAGDQSLGMAVNGGFSGLNAAPSVSGDETVFTYGPWRITLDDEGLRIEGPKIQVTGDVEIVGNADFSQGRVTSNGKRIDDTHVHTGVMSGASLTGTPS